MDAVEMTARIGLERDETAALGSRSAKPPRPTAHAWKIVCRDPGVTVDELIARLIDRLAPFGGAIGELVEELNQDEGGSCAVLQVVRYLNADGGEEEETFSSDPAFEKLPGQHQLLGWHLDRRVLQFLISTHAELDVDEYC
ncbi:DUF4279 domain-containing protein [Sphaerisporangium perillae]|uniref:DUF4279 domain-containing protein n=1 Tax=Sphaerisporangium perillae TaxID=2935860 RepID=UPI0024352B9D|nr:DUF4279 domain-containing protein [Sphaerisporangium perillae]